MDTVIPLLVLVISSLTKFVVPEDPPSFNAVVELVTKEQRVFSGESVRLRCNLTDKRTTSWGYTWFRGSEELPQREQDLHLWKARVQESGKYYCQGWKETGVGNIYTRRSLPVEIKVDGGWAFLQYQPHPVLVGDTLQITCRVRLNPQLEEVFLYKDGVEVMRQKDPRFHLTNATLDDQGDYSCRASWDINRQTRSVISSDVPVQVSEVLTEPVLEAVSVSKDKVKLICHVQYNARAPAPPVNYYFYKNNNRLGVATSENQKVVLSAPGLYSCRARVPQLDISRWSEPTEFGQ
ncbi:high affinity immunoglobulin epsilon receptor subunit alpha-like [Betta splendens]|uniref:high affinity immunoglobulin epsilon receptor subunit alpha-like n=1 Tax=Betta splendens TaxID=158456 RepID=UPI0010F56716|nr:high affinity immunoglobulin epsilon receptor subunit alpha-like [Betta splendens]